jgi:hypothetical protein
MNGVRVWKMSGKKTDRKKPRYFQKKFCPYATFSRFDPRGTGQESKPSPRGEGPATNLPEHYVPSTVDTDASWLGRNPY